jgi:excisionase family DNA binding protein
MNSTNAPQQLLHDPDLAPTRRLTASDIMTLAEVAELLHVPGSTVGDWARRGVIPSVKIGRRRIFIRTQIETVALGTMTTAHQTRELSAR